MDKIVAGLDRDGMAKLFVVDAQGVPRIVVYFGKQTGEPAAPGGPPAACEHDNLKIYSGTGGVVFECETCYKQWSYKEVRAALKAYSPPNSTSPHHEEAKSIAIGLLKKGLSPYEVLDALVRLGDVEDAGMVVVDALDEMGYKPPVENIA